MEKGLLEEGELDLGAVAPGQAREAKEERLESVLKTIASVVSGSSDSGTEEGEAFL